MTTLGLMVEVGAADEPAEIMIIFGAYEERYRVALVLLCPGVQVRLERRIVHVRNVVYKIGKWIEPPILQLAVRQYIGNHLAGSGIILVLDRIADPQRFFRSQFDG